MHITHVVSSFVLCLFSLSVSSAVARHSHRAHGGLSSVLKKKRVAPDVGNRTTLGGDDLNELKKRDGTKYVFMHHIVGNTYPYTQADWADDIQQIQAKGVDALALNIGSEPWQRTQIASAYAAAQTLGTNFKLFISFDFTAMGCDPNDVAARVNQFAHHPSQFRVNGKPMISSYSGDCLGNSGWASVKAQTNGYLMPFIWGLEGSFAGWPSLDSWYCWGCAWPQGNHAKSTDDDNYYLSQLGDRYATTISGWMYAHYDYKNFYQRGDDWLINNRWEQLVAMRNQLTFVEMVTWNDYGESDYFGPFKGAQPAGTTWATGFPHTAWYDMSEYYITAFKTGSYPAITQDVIYYWARPHPASATASSDNLGKPSGASWTEDTLWAAVFATSPCTVTLAIGSSTKTFTNVNAGVSKLKIPLAPGQITVTMVRNGQTVINKSPNDFTYVNNPEKYNYNAYVGSAKGGSVAPTTTTPTTSPTSGTPTTTSGGSGTTTAGSTAPSATSTDYALLGCVAEGTSGSRRALTGASFSQADMTPQVCQSLCSAYKYAGVEYGRECFCGNSLTNNGATGAVIPSDNCAVPCAGDSGKKCGGSWTLSVYQKGGSNPPPSSWKSAGCYIDNPARVLRASSTSQAGMTTEKCTSICAAGGYSLAGTEYASECFCGSQLFKTDGAGVPTSSGDCNMACSGNSGQKCGGSYRINLYTSPGSPPLAKRHAKRRLSVNLF